MFYLSYHFNQIRLCMKKEYSVDFIINRYDIDIK